MRRIGRVCRLLWSTEEEIEDEPQVAEDPVPEPSQFRPYRQAEIPTISQLRQEMNRRRTDETAEIMLHVANPGEEGFVLMAYHDSHIRMSRRMLESTGVLEELETLQTEVETMKRRGWIKDAFWVSAFIVVWTLIYYFGLMKSALMVLGMIFLSILVLIGIAFLFMRAESRAIGVEIFTPFD